MKVHTPIGKRGEEFIPYAIGSQYRTNCKNPGWIGGKKGDQSQSGFAFRWKRDKNGERTYEPVKHNAHHILSVCCVDNLDGLDSEQCEAVRVCCDETKWNINDSHNMIALPLFGHTIKWYIVDENQDPPQWENLPQHDYDHNSKKGYCTDVRSDILRFYETLQSVVEEDECGTLTGSSIATELNNKATKWRTEIATRGQGTHDAWTKMEKDWYKPFSMAANSNASRRSRLWLRLKTKFVQEYLTLFLGGA